MPNGVPNLGSFAGGDPRARQAIEAAIQARGQGANVPLASQTGQQPSAQVPQPTPSPQGVPPQSLPAQQGQGAQVPIKSEAELIIKGLTQRLSAISKVETAAVETPSQPSPRIAPTI